MAESSTKSGSEKASAQTATKDQKRHGVELDNDGNVKPLEYPEAEVKDSITYRDPRPLDWPQKADRSVFVSPVFQVDPDADVKGDYVDDAGLLDQDELEVGGDLVKDAQVLSGSKQLTLILNGKAQVIHPAIAGAVYAALGQALQMNANS